MGENVAMDVVIDISKETLYVVMMISMPLLLASLVVGVAVSLFQAVTQIQEFTLTFIPKITIIGFVLFLLLPWMLQTLLSFNDRIFEGMVHGFNHVSTF